MFRVLLAMFQVVSRFGEYLFELYILKVGFVSNDYLNYLSSSGEEEGQLAFDHGVILNCSLACSDDFF